MWSRRSRGSSDAGSADPDVLVFDVVGMHCASCGILIDEAVEELPVVAQSETSVRSAVARVRLVPHADPVEAEMSVRSAIEHAGYTAAQRT